MNKRIRLFFNLLTIIIVSNVMISCSTAPDTKKLEEVKNADWHYKMAAGYFDSHEIPRAIRELTISLEKDPKHADANYLMGFIYLGRNNFEKAYIYFDQAVKSRDNFFTAINNRGTTLLGLERWEEAMKDFEMLLEQPLYATPELAYNNLGWAHYNLGEFEAALQNYKMAIYLKPGFCLGYNNQGLALEAMELVDSAAESYRRAIEQCGEAYAEPHFHLGKIYASQGNPEALQEFQKCSDINPEAVIAARCREFMRALGH